MSQSEHILRFLLGELTTVRVRCKKCGAVVEVPTAKMESHFKANHCALCGQSYALPGMPGLTLLSDLGRLMEQVKQIREIADVEFVIPLVEPAK